ncbi:MAG: hypothetical protein AAF449_06520, partial [Myxococcota bacterium]
MLHADPDFARLSISTRQLLAQAMLSPLEECTQATPLQRQLVRALAHSSLGVEIENIESSYVPPERVKAALANEPEPVCHRYVQFLLMLELVADPLPAAMADAVERYVHALGVQEDMLVLARDYAEQAYGLALTDIARKGYFQDFSNHKNFENRLHVHGRLKSPFELREHDEGLFRKWSKLEHCKSGTLGRLVWEFYQSRGFIFPGAKGSVSPVLAQHDWIHVLADYGTVIDCELEVFGFISTAIPEPRGFSFLAAILGVFETGEIETIAGKVLSSDPRHLSRPGGPERLADALRRGRICHRDVMTGVDYFEYVDK